MNWRTDPGVVKALAKLNAVMEASKLAGHDLFRAGSKNSKNFDRAYEIWMRARAIAGGTFAISLEYDKAA